jgi:hypothetical protein
MYGERERDSVTIKNVPTKTNINMIHKSEAQTI